MEKLKYSPDLEKNRHHIYHENFINSHERVTFLIYHEYERGQDKAMAEKMRKEVIYGSFGSKRAD